MPETFWSLQICFKSSRKCNHGVKNLQISSLLQIAFWEVYIQVKSWKLFCCPSGVSRKLAIAFAVTEMLAFSSGNQLYVNEAKSWF